MWRNQGGTLTKCSGMITISNCVLPLTSPTQQPSSVNNTQATGFCHCDVCLPGKKMYFSSLIIFHNSHVVPHVSDCLGKFYYSYYFS